jgi:hypothetical protein
VQAQVAHWRELVASAVVIDGRQLLNEILEGLLKFTPLPKHGKVSRVWGCSSARCLTFVTTFGRPARFSHIIRCPAARPYLLVAGFLPSVTQRRSTGNYFQYVRRMVMSDAGGFESNRLFAPAGAATLINSVSFSASTWPAALHFPVRRATCMDGGVTNTDTGPALALLKSTQLVGAPPKPVG